MSADKDRILDKIKKCLALAESSNPNEAEAALRQARKLMDLHNVELGDVQATGASESALDAGKAMRTPPVWMCRLAQVCAKAFGCEIVLSRSWLSGRQIMFIGVGAAPTLAIYAFEVLNRQLQKARREFLTTQKRCKVATKRRRADEFANGWIDGVHRKVAQFAGVDEETAQAIQAYKAKHYPDMTTTELKRRETRARDASAALAGWQQGKSAQLHHGMEADAKPIVLEHCR